MSSSEHGSRQSQGPPSAQPDYYTVLGLTRASSAEEVRRAYRRLALASHPDKRSSRSASEQGEGSQPNASDDSGDAFRRISEAYQVLSDPQQRQAYDLACLASQEESRNHDQTGKRGRGRGRDPMSEWMHHFMPTDPFDVFEQFFATSSGMFPTDAFSAHRQMRDSVMMQHQSMLRESGLMSHASLFRDDPFQGFPFEGSGSLMNRATSASAMHPPPSHAGASGAAPHATTTRRTVISFSSSSPYGTQISESVHRSGGQGTGSTFHYSSHRTMTGGSLFAPARPPRP